MAGFLWMMYVESRYWDTFHCFGAIPGLKRRDKLMRAGYEPAHLN